ncbi:protein PFC0760c-like [Homarus americanus]|uniref:protein PFC0760c-like n=1 Tax=Homarus americanus TaxID=6706 RepID=UPI001C44DF92|nr:protein PFC0760c-like [Homarus americanus]
MITKNDGDVDDNNDEDDDNEDDDDDVDDNNEGDDDNEDDDDDGIDNEDDDDDVDDNNDEDDDNEDDDDEDGNNDEDDDNEDDDDDVDDNNDEDDDNEDDDDDVDDNNDEDDDNEDDDDDVDDNNDEDDDNEDDDDDPQTSFMDSDCDASAVSKLLAAVAPPLFSELQRPLPTFHSSSRRWGGVGAEAVLLQEDPCNSGVLHQKFTVLPQIEETPKGTPSLRGPAQSKWLSTNLTAISTNTSSHHCCYTDTTLSPSPVCRTPTNAY